MRSSGNDTRRTLAVIVTVVLGLAIGLFIKRVPLGILIGLALGLLLSGMVKKR
jgi:hypothetical protein